MRAGLAAVAAAAGVLAACGSSSAPAPTAVPGPATRYVLALDGMPLPGFTTVDAPHPVPTAQRPGGRPAGALDVAAARYFRSVPDLATANGPVDIELEVVRFDTAPHARATLQRDARRRDAETGEQGYSTGPLGDEAHADQRVVTDASSGVQVVQVTVEWAEGTLLETVVIRGRLGGTGLGDALIVAHRQDDRAPASGRATAAP